jgi:hypothetical protein
MGTRTTFAGIIRQRGMANASGNGKGTPATFKAYVSVTFLSSQTMAGTGVFLPAGAIPLGVTVTAISGGATDTVDVQLAGGTASGLADEVVSGVVSGLELVAGADIGVALLADTEIEAGVGSVAGTLNTTLVVSYIVVDDGVINN